MWTVGLAITAGGATGTILSGNQATGLVNGDDVLTPNRARALVGNQAEGFVGTPVASVSAGDTTYSGAMTVGALQTVATFPPEEFFSNVEVQPLTATTAIVLYKNFQTTVVYARVLTVSGDTVTAGPAITVYAVAEMTYISLELLSPTAALVVFRDSLSGLMRALILTISGTTVTENTSYQVHSEERITYPTNCLVVLSATSAMIIYEATVATVDEVRAKMLTISGTTITAGSEFVVASGSVYFPQSVKLTSTKALVTYQNYDNSQIYSRVLTEGAPITAGAVHNYGLAANSYYFMGVAEQTDTKVVVLFEDGTVRYRVATIDGTSVSTSSTGTMASAFYELRNVKLLDTQFFAAATGGLQAQVYTRASNVVTLAAAGTAIAPNGRPCLLSSGKVLLLSGNGETLSAYVITLTLV